MTIGRGYVWLRRGLAPALLLKLLCETHWGTIFFKVVRNVMRVTIMGPTSGKMIRVEFRFNPGSMAMWRNYAARMAGICLCLVALSCAAQGVAETPGVAGKVVFVTGSVTVDGRTAQNGQSVLEGQQLQTGLGGVIYLKTVDNGFLVLRQNSSAKVVTYHVDRENPDNTHVKYELMRGVARHVSGEAVHKAPQNFRFNTPVAAIGVRGTDFTVIADAEATRVSVLSGGIVISGYGEGCTPGGSGPCVSANSRELFSGDANAVLQMRRGEAAPELVRSRELHPDSAVPPRQDEPAKTSRAATADVDPSAAIDEHKKDLLSVAAQAAPVPPPQLIWGRWQALAELPASEAKLTLSGNGAYLPASIVGSYFLTRISQSDFALPKDGVFGFRLNAGEAYFVGAGDRATAASIQNPSLEIDFGKRQFNTSLQVVGGNMNVDIRAQGDVTLQGELLSDVVNSNAVVRGYTAGSNASQAAYIFSRQLDSLTRVVGGTSWAR